MLILRGTTDLIQVVTGSAADVRVHRSAMDASDAAPPVVQILPDLGPLAAISTATTTTIVAAPGSSLVRNVKSLSLYNNHASQSTSLRVECSDGTNTVQLYNCTLLAGELLVMTEIGTWHHYDSNGGEYPSIGNAATQAEMELATATDRFVTPLGLNWHPGACKCWGKAVGAGTSLTVSFNTTSITDTGTGRLGVTIGTDFSSANYSILASLERSVTALTATGVEDHAIRNASPAAGSFEIESYDNTAITFAAQDPQNYFWACYGDQ